MGYLVLTRREGEQLRLSIQPDADPQEVLKQLCTDGILLDVVEIKKSQVRMGISAPTDVLIMRSELLIRDNSERVHVK